MTEKRFGTDAVSPSDVEQVEVKTRTLGEGMSSDWEGKQTFTAEEVMNAMKEMDPKVGDLKVTDQILSHDGVLLSASFRAANSASGYSYVLKGTHGGTFRSRTIIDRIDYAGPGSEDVEYAEEIAEFRDGAWVKE